MKLSSIRFALAPLALSLALLVPAGIALAIASISITPATGGSSISADTTGGAYTGLTGPVITENTKGSVGTGTIILNAPSGFIFDTGGTAPTLLVSGDADHNKNINNIANGGTIAATSVSASAITFTTTSKSSGTPNTLTYQNVRVRPSAGTPLASGNLSISGTAGVSSSAAGALTEVVGVANKLAFNQQPTNTVAGSTITPPLLFRFKTNSVI